MKPTLVPSNGPGDVVETLEALAESARGGLISGLLVAVVGKGRRYHVSVVGSLVRDPTFGRGVCAAIDDELMSMVHHRAETSTTL